ncbi:hypothetical protein LTS10_010083 [Elasticomyces elasticus]|nr:hypothetical protein LTS10_010083 [Elasticomyces elasticus]
MPDRAPYVEEFPGTSPETLGGVFKRLDQLWERATLKEAYVEVVEQWIRLRKWSLRIQQQYEWCMADNKKMKIQIRNIEYPLKLRNTTLEAENNRLHAAHKDEIDQLNAKHKAAIDRKQGFLNAEEDNVERVEQAKEVVEEKLEAMESEKNDAWRRLCEWRNVALRYRRERDEAREFIRSRGFPRPGDDEVAASSVFRPRTPEIGGYGVPGPPLTDGASENPDNRQGHPQSNGSPVRGAKRPHSPNDEGPDTKQARTDPG